MYHPQTFLKECKYEIKKNKKENLINDDFDPSSFDESDNESDNDESKKSSKNLIVMSLVINLSKIMDLNM